MSSVIWVSRCAGLKRASHPRRLSPNLLVNSASHSLRPSLNRYSQLNRRVCLRMASGVAERSMSGGESSGMSEEGSAEDNDEDDSEYDNWGYDAGNDDAIASQLSFDVRTDPWWKEVSPTKRKHYLFCQRHKSVEPWNAIKQELGDEAPWAMGQIPLAVKTSRFDYRTIKTIKRFPSLGRYAQVSSHMGDRTRMATRMEHVKYNDSASLRSGVFYVQPNVKHLKEMLDKEEREKYWNERVDYRVSAGHLIRLTMYTNLEKKRTQSTVALCLMVRKKRKHNGSIFIRNVEKDGLTIIRQIPLWSPWIHSLKILKKYKVPRTRLYYMFKAPAHVVNPTTYAQKIGARSRSDHFRWLLDTEEGRAFARDERLTRRINFLGMRKRKVWAKRLADLYAATAIARNVKGPYRNARREMRYRVRVHPYHIDRKALW